MVDKSALIALAVGALVVVGALALPIDAATVHHHTLNRLARRVLTPLGESDQAEARPVRLVIEADAADTALLEAATRSTMHKVGPPGGAAHHLAFAPIDAADAPTLTLKVTGGDGNLTLRAELGEQSEEASGRLGDNLALLPPLLALILAVAFRRAVPALFVAVWTGATLLGDGNPFMTLWVELKGLVGAALAVFGSDAVASDGVLSGVISDSFNLMILGFTFTLVGLVAVVGRMGGTRGLVDSLSRLARGPRSAQVVTGLMGVAIFFDDYANTLVVGTTARSLTDDHRVSREKLSYIVDSTSAPVAGVAIISTWIGYEVGLFNDLLGVLNGVPSLPDNGYGLFFAVLPMRFYCIFALALVFLSAGMRRDIGPMYHAERRARHEGRLVPGSHGHGAQAKLEKDGVPPRALNALVPIGAVLATVVIWILVVGTAPLASFNPFSLGDWQRVFDVAGGDIALILFGGSLIGSAVAFALALGQRLLSPREAGVAYVLGMRALFEAAAVLILAWSIKSVCDGLGTGMAIVALIGDSLPPALLPIAIFVIAGAVAFATGTSWGTMALILPIAAPLAATLSGEPLIVLACLGAVLDGAIWGDHCSPISDTTVLSSTASGCPHLAHVRTQLPYATLAMIAAGLTGYLGVVIGLPVWLGYLAGLGLMALTLRVAGRNPDVAG